MNILVIGSGGREHALAWKISKSRHLEAPGSRLFCAPGNAGISRLAECIDIKADDIGGLLQFSRKSGIDLTVVGPEIPLTMGIVDEFASAGMRIFGASKNAAEIEGSKAFSKYLMDKYNIPTAGYQVFQDLGAAQSHVKNASFPLVIKASGLAAGKGVVIANNIGEALAALEMIMKDRTFGTAGDKVVIEEYLEGKEVSFLAFTDGRTVLPMPAAKDHKRIYDNDQGPNTGGMGVYSPVSYMTAEMEALVMSQIMLPAVRGMNQEGRPYKGVLYAGLMLTDKGPVTLEFNARFGDPETQPLMMRMKSDLIDVMNAVIDGRLDTIGIEWDKRAAVCVVMAAAGYPGEYQKGFEIIGLEEASLMEDVMVFHAGTSARGNTVVTGGGRVLGVAALGDGIMDAAERSYKAVSKISWEGVQYRRDIGGLTFS